MRVESQSHVRSLGAETTSVVSSYLRPAVFRSQESKFWRVTLSKSWLSVASQSCCAVAGSAEDKDTPPGPIWVQKHEASRPLKVPSPPLAPSPLRLGRAKSTTGLARGVKSIMIS